MPEIDQKEELISPKAGVQETDIDKEKDEEIASAMMALLLSALTVTVGSTLVAFIAYIFHLSIFVLR